MSMQKYALGLLQNMSFSTNAFMKHRFDSVTLKFEYMPLDKFRHGPSTIWWMDSHTESNAYEPTVNKPRYAKNTVLLFFGRKYE